MTAEKHVKTIPGDLAGLRLDQALAQMFPDYSRSRLKTWLLDGAVLVDGATRKPRDRVDGGEEVELTTAPELVVTSEAEPLALAVAWEDDAVLVIDKPAGLVVHPGAGNPSGTLLNGLLHHAPALAELPRAGIIHRIDKDTTGLLLVAKTLPAHTALVRALAKRAIARHYVAICNGVLTGGGRIDVPIGRHPVDRKRMAVIDGGRAAVTRYTVAERFRGHTRVDVSLETGRTHQIRVHFAHQRRPLLGDPVYGGRLSLPRGATQSLIDALRCFRRQALHAAHLAFAHPETGQAIEVDAPVPQDLATLLAVLREDARCA